MHLIFEVAVVCLALLGPTDAFPLPSKNAILKSRFFPKIMGLGKGGTGLKSQGDQPLSAKAPKYGSGSPKENADKYARSDAWDEDLKIDIESAGVKTNRDTWLNRQKEKLSEYSEIIGGDPTPQFAILSQRMKNVKGYGNGKSLSEMGYSIKLEDSAKLRPRIWWQKLTGQNKWTVFTLKKEGVPDFTMGVSGKNEVGFFAGKDAEGKSTGLPDAVAEMSPITFMKTVREKGFGPWQPDDLQKMSLFDIPQSLKMKEALRKTFPDTNGRYTMKRETSVNEGMLKPDEINPVTKEPIQKRQVAYDVAMQDPLLEAMSKTGTANIKGVQTKQDRRLSILKLIVEENSIRLTYGRTRF